MISRAIKGVQTGGELLLVFVLVLLVMVVGVVCAIVQKAWEALPLLIVVVAGLFLAFSLFGCTGSGSVAVESKPIEPPVPAHVQEAIEQFRVFSKGAAEHAAGLSREQEAITTRVTAVETPLKELREQHAETVLTVTELSLRPVPLQPVPESPAHSVEERPASDSPDESDAGHVSPDRVLLGFDGQTMSVSEFIRRWYRESSRFRAPPVEDLRSHLLDDHAVAPLIDQLDDETLAKLHIAIHEREAAQAAPRAAPAAGAAPRAQSSCPGGVCRPRRWRWFR